MPAAAAGSGVNRSRSERWFASRNPKTTISIEATAIRANPEIAAPNQPGEACRSPMGVNGDVLEATGMELPRDPKPLDRHSSLHLAGQLIRALIFDFDGLIIDTEEPIYRSWAEVYEAHGVPLPFDQWVKTVGSSNKEFDPQHHLEQQLGHPLAQGELDQRIQRRVELVLAQPLLPGVADLAGAARDRGLKVGVASSSSRDWVRGHLDRLGILDRFDCLRTRDDVEQVKPEPDLYLAVLDCLGVSADEAVAIEDAPNGIRSAKRAGLRTVAVANPITAGLDLSEADVKLGSLAELTLPQLLSRLEHPLP
ncbi:MAG: HAD family hydrolase [Chloroflexi bacterium]|nr:MAG: HAD family hydrolase [Chloroflexota bacterium]